MSQKEEKLKAAISAKFDGQTFDGIQIVGINNITIRGHKPEEIDDSRMEEWEEVAFAARIRGRSMNEDGYMESCYNVSNCSIGISYDCAQRKFSIESINQSPIIR